MKRRRIISMLFTNCFLIMGLAVILMNQEVTAQEKASSVQIIQDYYTILDFLAYEQYGYKKYNIFDQNKDALFVTNKNYEYRPIDTDRNSTNGKIAVICGYQEVEEDVLTEDEDDAAVEMEHALSKKIMENEAEYISLIYTGNHIPNDLEFEFLLLEDLEESDLQGYDLYIFEESSAEMEISEKMFIFLDNMVKNGNTIIYNTAIVKDTWGTGEEDGSDVTLIERKNVEENTVLISGNTGNLLIGANLATSGFHHGGVFHGGPKIKESLYPVNQSWREYILYTQRFYDPYTTIKVLPTYHNVLDVNLFKNEVFPYIHTVVLPSCIKTIPEKTFYNYDLLQNINLNHVENIGEYAFYNCNSLQNVDFSSKNEITIGKYAFANCSLEQVVISKNVKSIGEGAFVTDKQETATNRIKAVDLIVSGTGLELDQSFNVDDDCEINVYFAHKHWNKPQLFSFAAISDPDRIIGNENGELIPGAVWEGENLTAVQLNNLKSAKYIGNDTDDEISIMDDIYMKLGDERMLDIDEFIDMFSEEEISSEELLFHTYNPNVVQVDNRGMLKAVKGGVATILICNKADSCEAICTIYVSVDGEKSWTYPSNESDNPETNRSDDIISNSTGGKLNFTATSHTDSSIKLSWKKQKKVKYYKILRSDKKNKDFKTIKKITKKTKTSYIDKKVDFYKNYWYKLQVVYQNGKTLTSKPVKSRTKDSKTDIVLRVVSVERDKVVIEWNKQKNADYYEIYRRETGKRDGEDQLIASTNKKKYTDKDVREGQKYQYYIKVIKVNNKNVDSNKINIGISFDYDVNKNVSFFNTNYPFVCTDAGQDINNFAVFDGYYSPIKYSFDGKTLSIHYYCEFVRYEKNTDGGYSKTENLTDPASIANIDIFKKSVQDRYAVNIVNSKYEFVGINFDTKFVFHEKGPGYDPRQKFSEILIGGECPNCSGPGNHWYHEKWVPELDIPRIYMPNISQLEDNIDPKKLTCTIDWYTYTAAHEMAHSLGLMDGYNIDHHDRFTDNEETGMLYDAVHNRYDNLMVEIKDRMYLLPNDLEMILKAYGDSKGKSATCLQAYKTNKEARTVISDAIYLTTDLYDSEGEE